MGRQSIFAKAKKGIHKWFTLGLEEEQLSQYNALSEYNASLANDNLERLNGYCFASYILLLYVMFMNWPVIGITAANTVPYLLAFAGIFLIQKFIKRGRNQTDTVVLSYLLTACFGTIWYAVVFFYDIIMRPDMLSVMSCLAFVLLTSLFNTHPKDNIIAVSLAYVVMIVLDATHAAPWISHTDAFNGLIAIAIGVAVNQRNTRRNIGKKLYMDMYKATIKTSILVSQFDILHDTFVVLQSPSYMQHVLSQDVTARKVTELIEEQFVAEQFRAEFHKMVDFDTLSDRMEGNNQLSLYFLDVYQRWCQLVIVEQKRVNNQISAVIGIVRDVDEERRREFEYQEQLNAAVTEAKRASASKTSFLRRMSHDIRTPINGIRGMLEIAEHYSDDIEKQKECREKIWEASGYLLSLVNDVLDMNKLESGAIVLEQKPFDLVELLSEANTVAEMQAIEHGISYEINDPEPVKHRYLVGSPVHLKRILQNLAGNAVKYNREQGSVTVSCRELSWDESMAWFCFTCKDTGMGMSEEFQKHAFEPFAQEGRNANTTYAGTGLGLSIVKELAERMGGRIELSSELNVGSTFTLTIPIKINHELGAEKKQEQGQVETAGKRVLLVEDNELNIEIAQFLLEKEGFLVTKAHNGREAVEQFAASDAGTFDIIFMDIMMPVMNGLEATQAIRAMSRSDAREVPIIAMSANAFQDDIKNSLAAGMDLHLMKPIDVVKLKQAIQEVLGGKRQRERKQ